MFHSIVVDENDTKLAYIDSGIPACEGEYTTIFAVHGLGFTSPIFQKVSEISHKKGVRFVSINRRGYNGSTPFSDADKGVLAKGSDAEKTELLKQCGIELASFIDMFIQREALPKITPDGRRGGIALLGWSLGATFTASTIAHVGTLPPAVQERFASHVRAHIMQEPPSMTLGLPVPPQLYIPWVNPCIPEKARIYVFAQWITAYFQHGNLSTRDINVIEYVLPATYRPPSIWNMSPTEIIDIIDSTPYPAVEAPFGHNFVSQSSAVYKAATFDKTVRARLPHLKVWELVGEATSSFSIPAFWSIQDDDEAHGGNNVHFKVLPGMNHLMHWDEPEKTFEAYLEMLS